MKKLIIFMSMISFLLWACNNNNKNPNAPLSGGIELDSTYIPPDTLGKSLVDSMITHYLDTTVVNHSLDWIIKQSYLDGEYLKHLFINKNIVRVKLLTAAYLPYYSIDSMRNRPTVIIQLKTRSGSDSSYYYYDLRDVSTNMSFKSGDEDGICPLPYNCRVIVED